MSTTNVTHIHTSHPVCESVGSNNDERYTQPLVWVETEFERTKRHVVCARYVFVLFFVYFTCATSSWKKYFLFLISNRCRHLMRFRLQLKPNKWLSRSKCLFLEFSKFWVQFNLVGKCLSGFESNTCYKFLWIRIEFWLFFNSRMFLNLIFGELIRSWKNTAQTQTRFIFDAFVLVRNSYFDGKKRSIENTLKQIEIEQQNMEVSSFRLEINIVFVFFFTKKI